MKERRSETMADKIRRSFVLHGVAVSALNGSADEGEQPTSEEEAAAEYARCS